MIVTSDVLAATAAGLKTEFNTAYLDSQSKAQWNLIANEMETTLPTQKYGWLGRGATMQAKNDRPIDQPAAMYTYTVSDTEYQGVQPIERTAIEDDQYGMLLMNVKALAQEPTRHWNQLAFLGLALGFANLCYDGQTFFNANHQEGISPVQSNVTNVALSDANLGTAEAKMMAFVDDKGVPHEIIPDTLVVGPALAKIASQMMGSEVVVKNAGDGAIGSGATAYTPYQNYWKGRYRLVVSPYLIGTYQYYWFLLDTSKAVKPIFIQNRINVPIEVLTDMETPQAHMQGEYKFSVRGRYGQGYGLWQTAYGSNSTTAPA